MNRWSAAEPHSPPRRADRMLTLAARRRGEVERDRRVPVACPRCGVHLATVPPEGEAWCPRCACWVAADDGPPRPAAT